MKKVKEIIGKAGPLVAVVIMAVVLAIEGISTMSKQKKAAAK